MKSFHPAVFLSLFLAAGCASGGGTEWHFSEDDSGMILEARVGDEIFVTLPAGDDPACFWKQIQPVNPKVLLSYDMKRGTAKKNHQGPDVRVVQYRFRVIGEGFSGVSLERGMSDGGELPSGPVRFDLLVKSKGKPLELKDIFEEGPPPDTMTDSKGNVLPKPAELPGSPRGRN